MQILERKKDIGGKTGEILLKSSLVNSTVPMLISQF